MTATLERIDKMVKKYPVLLFMKGSANLPQCGFSARTADTLKAIGAPFAWCNVIADSAVRQELPQYQNWPTFPQLYINGELIGGCDIIMQMHAAGELAPLIQNAASAFADIDE